METVATYIEKPVGERLIDADNLRNEKITFNLFDEYSFIMYIEAIKNMAE